MDMDERGPRIPRWPVHFVREPYGLILASALSRRAAADAAVDILQWRRDSEAMTAEQRARLE